MATYLVTGWAGFIDAICGKRHNLLELRAALNMGFGEELTTTMKWRRSQS